MGNQVSGLARRRALAPILALMAFAPARAQGGGGPHQRDATSPAAGIELWMSTDSEKTDVVKLTARALWNFEGPTKYQGIDVEHAWFRPQGQRAREQTRAYVDIAGTIDGRSNWSARVGTNGHTVVGSASVRAPDWSKELFAEREIVETPRGLDEGIYYTLVGASADFISARQDTLNAMAGVQKFTGNNARLHLRGTYVHVVAPGLGLSIELRVRYFHSTVPGEFDYYSPRDFVQVVPVAQVRRFNHSGWMFLAAGGIGAQKATAASWQAARLADLRIESPRSLKSLQAFAEIQYANSSLVSAAGNYSYVLARLGLTRRF